MHLLPRREFVRQSSGAIALSALPLPLRAMAAGPAEPEVSGQPMPSLENPLPDPPERRVGIALVGLGAYALNQIAPNLANTRHARLAALVSGNPAKAQTVADAYGVGAEHVYSYDTFDRIADDDTVDVVYVILPNAFHREWTERAFLNGKHVLCEKPMAGTAEDCRAMIAAGEAAGKQLMIAYRAQFDPYNLRAIDLVQGGEIGEPRLVMAHHGRQLDLSELRDQWRAKKELAEGGSLYDIGDLLAQRRPLPLGRGADRRDGHVPGAQRPARGDRRGGRRVADDVPVGRASRCARRATSSAATSASTSRAPTAR